MAPLRQQAVAAAEFEGKNEGTVVAVMEIPDTLQSVCPNTTANVGNPTEYRRGTAKNTVPEIRFRSLN
ncbi:MAG: hypothetical protein RLZZ232_2369 [Planctomycetota bacterium]|jgi:hypothetical protein